MRHPIRNRPFPGARAGAGPRLAAASLLCLLAAAACHAHVTLTFPEGGEDLAGGSAFTIAWDADDHDCVYHLLFSPDSGATWEPVVQNLPQATRSYRWTVPDISTGKAVVRILQDNAAGTDLDDRSPVFRIHAAAGVRGRAGRPAPASLDSRDGNLAVTLDLPSAARVSLLAFDPRGRLVAASPEADLPAGAHRLELPLAGAPASRPLIFRLRIGDRVATMAAPLLPGSP